MTDEPTHIATAAALLDDPYAALSQHLHGDGDAPTAGDRLIASAAEAAVAAWRTRALTAEAEVERLRSAIPERDAEVRRAALEEAFAAIVEYPRAAPSEDEWMRYDEQIEHSQGIIRALIDATPQTTPACATPGCTNRPVIRLDDRRLCRDCYATHEFGDDA